MKVFRLYRVALRLRWMRHTDVLRLLANDLGGINPHRLALGAQQNAATPAELCDIENVGTEYDMRYAHARLAAVKRSTGAVPGPSGEGGGCSDEADDPPRAGDAFLPEFLDSLHLLADKANYDLLSEEWMNQTLFTSTADSGLTVVPLKRSDYHTVLVWVRGRHMGPNLSMNEPDSYVARGRNALRKLFRRGGTGSGGGGGGGGGDSNNTVDTDDHVERFSSVFIAVRMRPEMDPVSE